MNHLAIMNKQCFKKLGNEKTIESRVSKNKIAPYEQISENDVVYFKVSGSKFVTLKAIVYHVEFYSNNTNVMEAMRKHKDEIAIDESYINSKSETNYLTLIWLKDFTVTSIAYTPTAKGCRIAWFTNWRNVEHE